VLALSAVVEAGVRLVVGKLGEVMPMTVRLLEVGQNGMSLVFVVLVFALILRWLPPRPPRFGDALKGAVVAGAVFVGTKSLVAEYLERSAMAGVYGAAVTLVVILLWLYFTIQLFFVGAETAAYLSRKRAEERERELAGGDLD
jgi:membrane protein